MTELHSIPVTPETHERFTALQDELNLGSDECVRVLLLLAPQLRAWAHLRSPSIVAATDRLASDAGRIYSVLP